MPDGKLVELDESVHVHAFSATEAKLVYQEIFGDGHYDLTGLRDQPFVVDCGANIGLFTLFVKSRYPDAEILAFEPMPRTNAMLRRNVALHELESVTVHQVALGRATEPATPFTFYPMYPGNSTRHPETKREPKQLLAQTLPDRTVERLYRGQEVRVDVERLSTFLPAGRVIDLLKVDVEGSEVDVLLGIDDAHWPLIRQVVMEAHELDGRIDAACKILRHRGLEPVIGTAAADDAGGPTYLVTATAAAVSTPHSAGTHSGTPNAGTPHSG